MSRIRSVVLIVAAIALLGACGEESDTTGTASDSPGPSTAAPSDECQEGVEITTESGLKYEDVMCGDGDEAERGSNVLVHYTGTLEDGTKFDSSKDRNQPFPFTIGAGQVIAGWEEGVAGMQEGGTRVLTIPPELGYGKSGFPPVIPPDATLLFEIELLRVKSS